MKVLKFGGTSVGTSESLLNVKKIVENLAEPAIVVVSALGGLTDKLISLAKAAEAGDCDITEEIKGIGKRHLDIINDVVPEELRAEIIVKVNTLLRELENLYTGVSLLNELSNRTLDRIVSFGERLSSIIVSAMIKNSRYIDSLDFIKTEQWLGKNIADRSLTESCIKNTFKLPLSSHYVMGGFISTDRDKGHITNLGRGGSDYSAALVAAALNAEMLEIWTDVNGFLTADPRIVQKAHEIPAMTFVESMELCSFGAKVIYPPTIYPVFHKNIPIKILNTHNPEAPGTLITDNSSNLPAGIRGVSILKDTSLITVKVNADEENKDIESRTHNALSKAGVGVLLKTEPECEHDFCVSVKSSETSLAIEALSNEFAPELSNGKVLEINRTDNLAILAIVREDIKKIKGLGQRLIHTLQREDIKVKGISDGVSDATVALMVDEVYASKALQLAHDTVIN